MKSVYLSEIVEKLQLRIIHKASNYEDIEIDSSEINRPGLQLSGFLDEFPNDNIQVLGEAELAYLSSMEKELRLKRMENMMKFNIPCFIFSRGGNIPDGILKLAKKHDHTILSSPSGTTRLIARIVDFLQNALCPETRLHASFLEIYGSGVIIMGESSVGKSETALDLVIRGHRLVADDVVDVRKLENNLYGSCPEMIRHFLEIRGLGILNIRRLYGLGSVKTESTIDFVVSLEHWNEDKEYDRLGIDEDRIKILGVEVPRIVIPVKPGRNVAMIVEVAVRNQRQKDYGYNAALALNENIKKHARRNSR